MATRIPARKTDGVRRTPAVRTAAQTTKRNSPTAKDAYQGGGQSQTKPAGTQRIGRTAAGRDLWDRVRVAMMAAPSLEYEEIVDQLNENRGFRSAHPKFDLAALEGLFGKHEGRREFRTARDLAVAKALEAAAKKHPAGTPIKTLARLVADDVPNLEDHDIVRLVRRHPKLLGFVQPRTMAAPIPKPARDRIKTIALEHPTVDYVRLAELYAADPLVGPVRDWTEAQVAYTREPSRIVPTETKRRRALVAIAIEHLDRTADGTSLDDAVQTLAMQHPGVTVDQLRSLVPQHPTLAPLLARFEITAHADRHDVELTAAQAKKIDLAALLISRTIADRSGGIVDRIAQAIEVLEQNVGDNDGRVSPRDVRGPDPAIVKVMDRVYREIGRREHPLAAIRAELPTAIAAAARADKGGALFLETTQEVIQDLSDDYHQAVAFGGSTQTAFSVRRKMKYGTFKHIKSVLPAAFPDPSERGLDAARIDTIAELYLDLIEGKMTTTAFYGRARISVEQLQILQHSDPKRFPRPEDTPSWRSVAGRKNVRLTKTRTDELSKSYFGNVVTRKVTLLAWRRDNGVSKKQIERLMARHEALFPKQGRWPDKDESQMVSDLGTKATVIFDRDCLVRVPELIAEINRDPDFVRQHGTLVRSKYEALRAKAPKAFPRFRDPEAVMIRLEPEVRALLESEPNITPQQIVTRMKPAHPNFKLSRVHQLRKRFDGLIPDHSVPSVPPAQRRKDALLLKTHLQQSPGRSMADIAVELRTAKKPWMSNHYLHRLRREFRAQIFGGKTYVPNSNVRSSLVAAELLGLAMRLSPPGTNQAEIARALDRLLEKRGLEPYGSDRLPSNLVARAQDKNGKIEAHSASVTAAIYGEYKATFRGETTDEIDAQILADYPSIDRQKLSTYQNIWARDPKQFPALRRRAPEAPRYVGGWDVERAVIAPAKHDKQLAAELADASQFARIPMRLPLLDEMVEDLGGKPVLHHTNMLWVTHLLASSVPLANALRSAGLQTTKTSIVGTPYGTNDAVKRELEDGGFDIKKPDLSSKAYFAAVEKALDETVARHRKNGEPIVVLDDGGIVAELLHSKAKYKDVIGAFKMVEQTTRGITAAEKRNVRTPIVNVARSESKKHEGKVIGRSVAAKVLQGLARLGRALRGTRVTITGYGVVGKALARELKRAGAIVTVVETSPARRAAAKKAGYSIVSKSKALKTAQIVVGCVGKQSLSIDDLALLPNDAVICSASSKQLEIDMASLTARASERTLLEDGNPLVHLPTAAYRLGRKKLTVLGDGWPVNFDGDVEDIPAEEIQITRALMFAGALQAVAIKPHQTANQRIIPLDPAVDEDILTRYLALSKGRPEQPIGDPSKYLDVIREAALVLAG